MARSSYNKKTQQSSQRRQPADLFDEDFKRSSGSSNTVHFTSLYDPDASRKIQEENYKRGSGRGFGARNSKNSNASRPSGSRSGSSYSNGSSTRSYRSSYSGSSYREPASDDFFETEEESRSENRKKKEGFFEKTEIGSRTKAVIRKMSRAETKGNFSLPQIRHESNFAVIACTVLLCVIGLVMVASSSYYYAYTTTGDSLYFFRRQLIFVAIGVVVMIVASRFPLKLIRNVSFAVYLVAVACTILVLRFGTSANGSTRWLGVGSFSFQPAELAKLGVALYVSRLVEDEREHMKEGKTFFKLLIVIGIPAAFVAYQNLSSGVIIAAIGVVIMFVGGAKFSHFLKVLLLVGVPIVILLVIPLIMDVSQMDNALGRFLQEFSYRSDRISAWRDPFGDSMGDGYQTVQALYAVGSGGFFGRGLGQSIQKMGYIPFAYNDIIFAVICEELGVLGAGLVMVLFGIFAWNGIKISLEAPNSFTSMLSLGLVSQIALQAVLNIAVNLNAIPATGISLPFISYGGSSMLFLMGSVGLIVNISTYSAEDDKETKRSGRRVSAAGNN